MPLPSLHVVIGGSPYEFPDPLRAFRSEAKATAFMARCVKHLAKKPQMEEVADDASEDTIVAAWERHDKALDRWRRRSPWGRSLDLGESTEFWITPVPFDGGCN